MATKTIRAKKNPVAVAESVPQEVINELLELDIEDGRFIAFSEKTFEYIQDDNKTKALTLASRDFGFHNVNLLDLSQPDGVYRVKLPRRITGKY